MPRVVLVAEDELLSQRLVTAVIEYCGLTAVIVSNGQECLDQLNKGLEPELILLDLDMPVMNGIEVLEALKAFPPESRCPIVVFTANNQSNTVIEAVKLGADDFVVKPFKSGELAQRIKDLTFEIGEMKLKSLLHGLQAPDLSLQEERSLIKRVSQGYELYPMVGDEKRMCLSLPQGQLPQILARLSLNELSQVVCIYRKCAFGWRKVWPRSTKLAKKSSNAS
ncbi:MAG: response regulator [Chitinophagaceae bacterium]|nr:response regulator [Oligoflexus sp.]